MAVLIATLSGCGGSSSSSGGDRHPGSSSADAEESPQEARDARCVEEWNAGRFPESGGLEFLARRVLLTTEGQAVVTTDSNGICLVAFPESAGSEPGGGGGAAFTYSLERGSWGLYDLISHESYSLNPAILEEQRSAINARVALMQELGREVEVNPNAFLDPRGRLSLLGSPSSDQEPQKSSDEPQVESAEEDGQSAGGTLEEEILGVLESAGASQEGASIQLTDLRMAGESWTAATVSIRLPGQGPDTATAIFHQVGGAWTLFEIGSSFVGSSHCPPRLIAFELEVECGTAPTQAPSASAEEAAHPMVRAVELGLRSHFDYLEAGQYKKAYEDLTTQEGQSLGGEEVWIADQRQDRLLSHELSVKVEFEGASRATAAIDEFRTRSQKAGCQSWTGAWTMFDEGGRWLIDGADLEAESCG